MDPAAGDELLDLAIDRAREERHVIAFCSCGSPFEDGERACHRTDVAELVRAAATKRGVTLRTIEWPGGEPEAIQLDTDPAFARAIARGTRNSIPLGPRMPAAELTGLAWGSQVRVAEDLLLVSGPARCDAKGWSLPVMMHGNVTDKQGQKEGRAWRKHKLVLRGGRTSRLDGLFVMSRTRIHSPFAESLGCQLEEGPVGAFYKTDVMKETTVPGVFACGDAGLAMGAVSFAVADGVRAGVSAHQSLVFRKEPHEVATA